LWTKGVYEDATIKASLIASASTPRLYGPRRVSPAGVRNELNLILAWQ
jgi:hypothetical protein